ncbi:MAG TPA: universal stress protein, partial [Saprospiraceae bacterium]|nr:universal stress protein [Saprospiraceae bacterium]
PNEGVDNSMYDAFFIDDYVNQRLAGMKEWVQKFSRSPHLKDVQIDLECRMGFPVSTIVEVAEDKNASLIVMGTTGATGLKGMLLGSTAAGVLGKSKVPVLVVPAKATFRNFARFALATDFKMPVSRESLHIMREVLNIQHTGLNIVHVLTSPQTQPDEGQEDLFSDRLSTIPHDFHYLHDTDVPRAIHNFLEATECNGLVAVAHEHSLMHRLFSKSVSRALAHRTTVPMLVLHDK